MQKSREINERHQTVIMVVEHNIKSLLDIASRGYVLDKGKVVAKDSSQKLLESGILERMFVESRFDTTKSARPPKPADKN